MGNSFKGKLEVKDDITGKKREFDLEVPGIKAPNGAKTARASVQVQVGRNVDYGRYSYKITLGGELEVSREDYQSGRAHQEMANHLAENLELLVDDMENGWIPEAFQLNGKVVLLCPREEEKE